MLLLTAPKEPAVDEIVKADNDEEDGVRWDFERKATRKAMWKQIHRPQEEAR